MMSILIQGKANGKSISVYSLVKPKDVQGKPSKTFIDGETIISIDKNLVVVDQIKDRNDDEFDKLNQTIKAFIYFDNPLSENVIDVTMNVKVPTTKIGIYIPMHDSPTHSDPKDVGENGNENVCKDVIEDVNDNVSEDVKDDFNEDLNQDEFVCDDVKNDDIYDEDPIVRKSPTKTSV